MLRRVVEVVVKMKDQASGKLDDFSKKIGISKGAILGLAAAGVAMGAALVTAFKSAVSAAIGLVNETAKMGDELDKMSTRTSVAVESLAEWIFLMERAGGNAGTLEAGVRRLTRSMYDQTQGVAESVRVWDQLGISVTDSSGELKAVDAVLLELSDALSKMDNQTEALGLSQSILGRGASQMVALLAQGRPELERQLEIFKAINGEMSTEYTKGAAAVIDAQTDMQHAVKGLKADLLEPILPMIAETIDDIAESVGELGRWIEDNQDQVKAWSADIKEVVDSFVVFNTELFKFTVENGPNFNKFMKVARIATGDFSGVIRQLTKDTEELNEETPEATKHFDDMTASFERMIKGMNPQFVKETANALKEIREAPTIGKDMTVPGEAIETEIMLLEELIDLKAEQQAQLAESHQAESDRMAANMEALAAADDAYQVHIDNLRQMEEENMAVEDGLYDLQSGLQSVASSSLSAFLQSTNQAIMFGTMLKTVVLDALSQVIVKLLFIKALSFFSGGAGVSPSFIGPVQGAAGGTPLKMAGGGTPGYSINTGAPGMDAVPALLMRGENVTDRTLSQQLKSFLDSQNSASIISPLDLAVGGSGNVSVALNIARPVGILDVMDLGESAVAAARLVSEADL
jgi:hypothetical protein